MGRASESKAAFDIFDDNPQAYCEDGHFIHRDEAQLRNSRLAALRQVSFLESQNRQSRAASCPTTESLHTKSKNPYTKTGTQELSNVEYRCKRRLTRPTIAPDTFNSLEPVPESEDESQFSPKSATGNAVDSGQCCIQLPGMSLISAIPREDMS